MLVGKVQAGRNGQSLHWDVRRGQRHVGVAMLALEGLEGQAKELGPYPAWGAGRLRRGVQAEVGSGLV